MKIINNAKLAAPRSSEVKRQSIYDIKINALDGAPISLLDFKGKKLLFVN